jgi:hypothetical protein
MLDKGVDCELGAIEVIEMREENWLDHVPGQGRDKLEHSDDYNLKYFYAMLLKLKHRTLKCEHLYILFIIFE